mmetsp:Transcript_23865/g.74290  ORF Transcript_23865/g.74290 Transcript_23865/m.74290 type:complete len:205 (+) Transcript_23865:388-1002(+)
MEDCGVTSCGLPLNCMFTASPLGRVAMGTSTCPRDSAPPLSQSQTSTSTASSPAGSSTSRTFSHFGFRSLSLRDDSTCAEEGEAPRTRRKGSERPLTSRFLSSLHATGPSLNTPLGAAVAALAEREDGSAFTAVLARSEACTSLVRPELALGRAASSRTSRHVRVQVESAFTSSFVPCSLSVMGPSPALGPMSTCAEPRGSLPL